MIQPSRFKVTEGAGPGLFTLEDITGNEVPNGHGVNVMSTYLWMLMLMLFLKKVHFWKEEKMCNNEVGMNRYIRVYGIQNNGWIQLDMVPVLIVYEWFRNLEQDISEGCQITSTGFFSEIPFDVSSLHWTFWLDLTSNHRCLTGPRSLEVLMHDEVTAAKRKKGKSKKGGKSTEKPLCETHQVMVVTGCFGRHIWKAWETVLIQVWWPIWLFFQMRSENQWWTILQRWAQNLLCSEVGLLDCGLYHARLMTSDNLFLVYLHF